MCPISRSSVCMARQAWKNLRPITLQGQGRRPTSTRALVCDIVKVVAKEVRCIFSTFGSPAFPSRLATKIYFIFCHTYALVPGSAACRPYTLI